jgi:hypothetical protein
MFDKGMNTALTIICLIVFGSFPALAQLKVYDSRIEPPPHAFTWEDAYEYVDIWGSAQVDINGGFLTYVKLWDSSTGTITDGHLSALSANDNASLLVLGVDCEFISAWNRGRIDLYGCEQSGFGQVWTIEDGVIRVFGGNYGWVQSMADNDGRVEVSGNASIKTLSSSSQGMVFQRGAKVDRFGASGLGVSVLDDGEVFDLMSAGGSSTLVLAGGYPASDIRLFGDSRLLILHTDDARPDYMSYQLPDFDIPGAGADFAGKNLNVSLDGSYKNFLVSAWTNTEYLSDNLWRGRMELVKIGNNLTAFRLNGEAMLVAFRAPGDEVIQIECSTNLVTWQPWKSAFPGDWNVHVEGLRTRKESQLFLRLRKWPKPGS